MRKEKIITEEGGQYEIFVPRFPLGSKFISPEQDAEMFINGNGMNMLYNHHDIIIKYHVDPTSYSGRRIVGFIVNPKRYFFFLFIFIFFFYFFIFLFLSLFFNILFYFIFILYFLIFNFLISIKHDTEFIQYLNNGDTKAFPFTCFKGQDHKPMLLNVSNPTTTVVWTYSIEWQVRKNKIK